jgi:RNA-directed DNA polymerase
MANFEKRILKKFYFCDLKAKEEEVNQIIDNIDYYYDEIKKPKFDKDGKLRKNKFGDTINRVITPSLRRLSIIQKNIHKNILLKIPLDDFIQGGVKGKSNISNAKTHLGRKYKFTTDIEEFFPFINHKRVFKMFCRYYHPSIATILSKLTTYKGQLPQGAPTSTYIANLVFLDIDKKLMMFCKENKITFTIFVDDLTFSSHVDFKEIIPDIIKIINSAGFRINNKKTFYRNELEITGIVVKNNILDVPLRIKRKFENIKDKENNSTISLLKYIHRVKRG